MASVYCECGNRLEAVKGHLCGLCTIYKVGLQDLAMTLKEAEREEIIQHGRRIKARLPTLESFATLDSDADWVELVPDANGVIHIDWDW